jgi:hypothetical protein
MERARCEAFGASEERGTRGEKVLVGWEIVTMRIIPDNGGAERCGTIAIALRLPEAFGGGDQRATLATLDAFL